MHDFLKESQELGGYSKPQVNKLTKNRSHLSISIEAAIAKICSCMLGCSSVLRKLKNPALLQCDVLVCRSMVHGLEDSAANSSPHEPPPSPPPLSLPRQRARAGSLPVCAYVHRQGKHLQVCVSATDTSTKLLVTLEMEVPLDGLTTCFVNMQRRRSRGCNRPQLDIQRWLYQHQEHCHHCPCRSWQNHPGGLHAQAGQGVPREPVRRHTDHGLQRPGAGARHHHSLQEHCCTILGKQAAHFSAPFSFLCCCWRAALQMLWVSQTPITVTHEIPILQWVSHGYLMQTSLIEANHGPALACIASTADRYLLKELGPGGQLLGLAVMHWGSLQQLRQCRARPFFD